MTTEVEPAVLDEQLPLFDKAPEETPVAEPAPEPEVQDDGFTTELLDKARAYGLSSHDIDQFATPDELDERLDQIAAIAFERQQTPPPAWGQTPPGGVYGQQPQPYPQQSPQQQPQPQWGPQVPTQGQADQPFYQPAFDEHADPEVKKYIEDLNNHYGQQMQTIQQQLAQQQQLVAQQFAEIDYANTKSWAEQQLAGYGDEGTSISSDPRQMQLLLDRFAMTDERYDDATAFDMAVRSLRPQAVGQERRELSEKLKQKSKRAIGRPTSGGNAERVLTPQERQIGLPAEKLDQLVEQFNKMQSG